ncbi:MAG: hypothetical protein JO112_00705 [Planctomycetes bacterium]|nr:hypothetical protein [Planctomycetota bacterium]
MTRATKALVLFLTASLGLWGCTQAPPNRPVNSEQIKALQARVDALGKDYREAAEERDKIAAEKKALQQQLTAAQAQCSRGGKEREDLQQQLTSRIAERDAVQGQYEQFRKNIKELLGQAEAAAGSAQPVTVTVSTVAPGKS